MATRAKSQIKIGTQFSSQYMDGNVLWTVFKKSGREAWLARAEEDPDWRGTEKAFTTTEIERSLAHTKMFDNLMSEHDKYYELLKIGQIVHYHNGFGQFVRCRVIESLDKYGKNGNMLIPLALVGNWREFDLPKRRSDGTIHYPYSAKCIVDHEPFKPNFTNIWEASESLRKQQKDPTHLAAISLEVPDMTEEDFKAAEWERLRKKIFDLTGENGTGITAVKNVIDLLKKEKLV